jgi:hypothetical protein
VTVLSCKYRSQVRLRNIDLLIFVWLYSAFIPGHFHLTIGVVVALSYVGIVYWLIPYFARTMVAARRTGPGFFVFLRSDDFLARADGGRNRGDTAVRLWPGFPKTKVIHPPIGRPDLTRCG